LSIQVTGPGVAGAATVPAAANEPEAPSARSMLKLLSPVRDVKVSLMDCEVIAVAETPMTGGTTAGSVLPPSSLPQAAASVSDTTEATAAKCRVIDMRVVLGDVTVEG
jgi:hypothetical protein